MKKLFPILGLIIFLTLACNREEDQRLIDAGLIDTYIKENSLTASYDGDEGLYYIITDEGSLGDEHPTQTSDVTLRYNGYFLDGIVFDTIAVNDSVRLNLTRVIEGLQIGIPKFTRGGEGTLLIPSHLAYGSQGTEGIQDSGMIIPPNAVLAFGIELIDFE